MDADSDRLVGNVGLVSPRKIQFDAPLELECGRVMPAYDIVYETYGELNAARDNAILVCHALSGDHHAAGYNAETDRKPGWWDHYIGPGKPIDTKLFHVVSLNNLGGCGGSTGPNSINPETGKPWGADFPVVTVKDWVKVQARLADSLGIDAWVSIAGGSLGAMQGLQWAIDFPDRVRSALIIAAAPRLSAQNIAFNEIARKAIQSDPNFLAGGYEGQGVVPRHGLMLARMLGHVTYLSDDLMRSKFGRDLRKGKIGFDFDAEFQVESYLRHQGEAFVDRFDANTYLLMTKALDYFDPAMEYGDNLTEAVRRTRARFLAVAFSSDWRFSPERSREIVKALHDAGRPVSYVEIDSADGHDAFLLPNADYAATLRAFLRRVHNDFCGRAGR